MEPLSHSGILYGLNISHATRFCTAVFKSLPPASAFLLAGRRQITERPPPPPPPGSKRLHNNSSGWSLLPALAIAARMHSDTDGMVVVLMFTAGRRTKQNNHRPTHLSHAKQRRAMNGDQTKPKTKRRQYHHPYLSPGGFFTSLYTKHSSLGFPLTERGRFSRRCV